MLESLKNKFRLYQTRFSFGATSAVITNLGIISGLNSLAHPKLSIICGILVIALADNIADSLGIHIHEESEYLSQKEVWVSTFTNFLTRILVSLTFALLIIFLPITWAVVLSVIWGMLFLSLMSYTIAKNKGINPYLSIFEHIGIATIVIIASSFIGKWIISKF